MRLTRKFKRRKRLSNRCVLRCGFRVLVSNVSGKSQHLLRQMMNEIAGPISRRVGESESIYLARSIRAGVEDQNVSEIRRLKLANTTVYILS